jgi:hypothetical protein
MNHHFHGLSRGTLTKAAGALALSAALCSTAAVAPAQAGVLGLGDDQPATTQCDRTFTGQNNAVINVAAPYTYCLDNLKQTGAVNVSPGAALSVTGGSIINGAITLVTPKAFTFCASSTLQGAIKSSTATGFVLIGSGGDSGLLGTGLLGTPCGANHIDGAVTLNGNLGGVEVGGNSIVGALTVSGNIAPRRGMPTENNATEIEGNTVKGLTTCANNIPAPTNDGLPNTFTGSANGQCVGL